MIYQKGLILLITQKLVFRVYEKQKNFDKNNNLVFLVETHYPYKFAMELYPKAKFLSSITHNDRTLMIENVA